MSAPIPVAWWVVVLAAAVLCLGFYVLGGEHNRRDEDWRIRRVVQTSRYHETLLRHLFGALELLMPEMEPEPRPGLSRRVRILRALSRLWVSLKGQQRPTVLGAQPVDEAEEQSDEEDFDPETFTIELPPNPTRRSFVLTSDPMPATDPRGFPPLPGPETVPSQAVITDDWAARSAQMLAEARAAIAEIGGKR